MATKQISIYTYDGSGSLGATYTSGPYVATEDGLTYRGGGYPATLGSMLRAYDPLTWVWKPMEYKPLIFGAHVSIERGLEMGRTQIIDDPNYIVLSGLSQGTFITSNLYNEFRYGALQAKRDDLIAIVNFGDALRPEGWTIPAGGASTYLGHAEEDVLDPGGHGACMFPIPLSYGDYTGQLVDPEDFYWSFANMHDPATTIYSDDAGMLQSEFAYDMGHAEGEGIDQVVNFAQAMARYFIDKYQHLGYPLPLIKDVLGAITQWIPFEIPTDIGGIIIPSSNPHAKYGNPDPYTSLDNNTKSAVVLGFEYLSQLGREYAGDPLDSIPGSPASVGWWVTPPV